MTNRDCCDGICGGVGSHKAELQGMIQANEGRCWVMNCVLNPIVKDASGVEFCSAHADRLKDQEPLQLEVI
jgi:hypothetical protein